MTQPTIADVQRPPTFSGPGGVRSSIRPSAPVRRPTNVPRSSTQVVDLTNDGPEREGLHPAKRRRVGEAEERQSKFQEASTSLQTDALPRTSESHPPLSFSAQLAQIKLSDGAGTDSGIQGASNGKLPPLPIRPWKHKPSQADTLTGRGGANVHIARDYGKVQAAPFRLEPPPKAPSYREERVADFMPWTGKHAEDVMNDHTAKQGYYDRQISQNETGTARPSLYSVFKHKSGLDTLSSLFLRVVEQRDTHGKIGSTSTFKPPPRVTLTEAKRKAWLNDLSNSDVPLRKLSRTIPQGIRGQQLLEQCLHNTVPIGRAVWFAKCVGANEIRTLKRKGTAGTFVAGAELKWLKEWTTGVELFFDEVVSSCGEPNWKSRITYAVNVITRFYSENMVDKDHFIEWIVGSVAKSPTSLLPLWTAVCRGYLKDIVRLRRHGCVLAEALLEHLKDARTQHTEDFTPLISLLTNNIRLMAATCPLLFLLPHAWEGCKDALVSCFNLDDPADRSLSTTLIAQNQRFRSVKDISKSGTLTPKQTVIKVLDTARPPFHIVRMSEAALKVCPDRYTLVRTILEWSSTPFRAGNARKYVAVHLLRRWHSTGIDIDQPVRDLVTDQEALTFIDADIFFRVTAELFITKTISISRCLQLALATGAAAEPASHQGVLRLIRDAPMHDVPSHVANLRQTILAASGYPVHQEREQILARKGYISRLLPSICDPCDEGIGLNISNITQVRLPACVRSEMSSWILSHIAAYYRHSPLVKSSDAKVDKPISALTSGDLRAIRTELEAIDDIPVLADALRHACTSEDDIVLGMASETVHAHFDEFSAIGALEPLYTTLCAAYSKSRSTANPSRIFTISLLNLTLQIANNPINRAQLLEDLARGDRNVAIAACSPISDYMAESLQQAGPSFIDEFDQLLSTGNIMDDQAMTRLFHTLTDRIERIAGPNEAERIQLCHMLLRLMTFRPKQFDQLLQNWLTRLLQSPKLDTTQIVELLIGSGVTASEQVFLVSSPYILDPRQDDDLGEGGNVCNKLIYLFDHCPTAEEAAKNDGAYRLRYCTKHCLENVSPAVAPIVSAIGKESIARSSAKLSGQSWEIRHMLQQLNDESVAACIASFNDSEGALVIRGLLGLEGLNGSVSTADLSRILQSRDPFSLPLRLSYLKNVYEEMPKARNAKELSQEDVIDLVFEIAKQAPPDDSTSWTAFLVTTGTPAAQKIRHQAEEAFFALPPPQIGNQVREEPASTHLSHQLVSIVERTAFTIPDAGIPSTASSIAERLQSLFRYVTIQSQHLATEETEGLQVWTDCLRIYFSQLLRLASLHHASLAPAAPAPQASITQAQSQVQIRALLLLTSLALHPSLQTITTASTALTSEDSFPDHPILLSDFALHVAALLSDHLSFESRLLISKNLKDRMRDARTQFLFGSLNCSEDLPSNQLIISREGSSSSQGKEPLSTNYKPRSWELVQGLGGNGNDTSMSLSLFQGRVVKGKQY